MNIEGMTHEEACGLRAVKMAEGWAVDDIEGGGRWFPDTEAARDIAAASDPADEAVRVCDEEPMRGEWRY